MNPLLASETLTLGNKPVLESVPSEFSLVEDRTGAGVFLRVTIKQPTSYFTVELGRIAGLKRLTCCHRAEPFWMNPSVGNTHAAVRPETQWVLAETTSGAFVIVVPLFDGAFRFALSGSAAGLTLVAETGDAFTAGNGGTALFVAMGDDPYALCAAGARAVAAHLGTTRLRHEKPAPDFIDQFGWCTWDAFYREVTAEKVREGLAAFAAGGVEPRLLILDDGWLSFRVTPTGEERLTSLKPNAQLGGNLAPTVHVAKNEYKVRTFLVWHALNGYWSGVDGTLLTGYGVKDLPRLFGPGIMQHEPFHNVRYWGALAGLVPASEIARFYDDFHALLRSQGVDGVKVDVQSLLEGISTGQGGRVALARAYRAALEGSVEKHFGGRLINCMGSGQESYYLSPRSTVIRTSIDFWPKKPETHGLHLYTNAQVGTWFGEFMQPDWDMFWSAHPAGAFHAAARAVSGGPVYVSDKPGVHDFALLNKLVLSDGSVLRADLPARPTRDCLFANVTRDPVLLKIFNFNRDCAVVGVFNCNYTPEGTPAPVALTGAVAPEDVPGLRGRDFIGFAHQSRKLWRCTPVQSQLITLPEGGWEIVSFAPVEAGVAVLGLADKFNSTGAILAKMRQADGSLTITLRDGGEFLAWCQHGPQRVTIDAQLATKVNYDAATGRLTLAVPAGGRRTVQLWW
jgi:raffinose synthase